MSPILNLKKLDSPKCMLQNILLYIIYIYISYFISFPMKKKNSMKNICKIIFMNKYLLIIDFMFSQLLFLVCIIKTS